MHIKIKTPDRLTLVQDNPGLYRWIPCRNVRLLLKAEMEEFACRIEDALLHLGKGEIRPHRLGIEVVLRATELLGDVPGFIVPDFFGAGSSLPLFRQKHLELTLRQWPRRIVDALDKIADVLAPQDHLVGGVVVGPVGVSQQRCDLVSRLQQIGQDFLVLWIGAGLVSEIEPAAQGIALAEGEHRESIWVIRADANLSVRTGLVVVDEILRKPVYFAG